jgi:hypothetical protein
LRHPQAGPAHPRRPRPTSPRAVHRQANRSAINSLPSPPAAGFCRQQGRQRPAIRYSIRSRRRQRRHRAVARFDCCCRRVIPDPSAAERPHQSYRQRSRSTPRRPHDSEQTRPATRARPEDRGSPPPPIPRLRARPAAGRRGERQHEGPAAAAGEPGPRAPGPARTRPGRQPELTQRCEPEAYAPAYVDPFAYQLSLPK